MTMRWTLLALAAVTCVDAYKILVIFPMPGRSHGILGDGIVKHLLNAGHEVTLITPFVDKKPNPKLTQIDVSKNMEFIPEDMLNLTTVLEGKSPMVDHVFIMYALNKMAAMTLENDAVQNLLKDQTKTFDLVIGEWLFTEVYSGIAAVYDVPFVYSSSVEPHSLILNLVDGSMNPAYSGFLASEMPPFSFMQRVSELWTFIKITAFRETIMAYLQDRLYQRLIAPHIENRGRTPPSFSTLKYNASLVLGNSHVSIGESATLPQIYKPISGYHIDDQPKPLTEDLKKLLDSSKHGLIYFSMGSNLKSKHLPLALKKDLLNMFGSLKQTVLWKFEEVPEDLPSNVHILQWAPQQSILSHPNCILFINHGGLLSTAEAIHTATPVIGIPVMADQHINAKRAVSKGFGLQVDLSYSMVPKLKEAIDEMVTNPKYLQKVKELSFVYHDRPMKPAAEMVHWVEHVIKTKGALHLRSPGLNIPWYQKTYLDLALLVSVVVYVLSKILKLVKQNKNVDLKKKKM